MEIKEILKELKELKKKLDRILKLQPYYLPQPYYPVYPYNLSWPCTNPCHDCICINCPNRWQQGYTITYQKSTGECVTK